MNHVKHCFPFLFLPTMSSSPETEIAKALVSSLMPLVTNMSRKLVDLQEQQQILVASVAIQREELLNGSEEWRLAKETLDKIPGKLLCIDSSLLPFSWKAPFNSLSL